MAQNPSAAQDEAAVFTSTSTIVAPQGRITTCQDYSQAHHMPCTGKLVLSQKNADSVHQRPGSAMSAFSCLKMTGTNSKWVDVTFMSQTRYLISKKSQCLLSVVSQ